VPEKANRAVKVYVAALDDVAFGEATTGTPKSFHLLIRQRGGLRQMGACPFLLIPPSAQAELSAS